MSREHVGATKVMDEDTLFASGPGIYMFKEKQPGIKGILFNCPCSCGAVIHLPIYFEGEPKPSRSAWIWDGNEDTPSLQPSIKDLRGCRFHGFLTAGYWTFCDDSGVGAEE